MAVMALDRGVEVLAGRAKLARIASYVLMSAAAGQILAGLANLADAGNITGESPVIIVDGARALVFMASSVFVGMWIYRAHANLRAAGAEGLTISPGWAIGWFFVPFANLYKPFEAMRQLWYASDMRVYHPSHSTPGELKIWWASFLFGIVLDNIGSRVDFNTLAVGGKQAMLVLMVVSGVAVIVSAWFLLRIINRVTQAQQDQLGIVEVFA